MKSLQRNILTIIVLAAVAIVAYTIGKQFGDDEQETKLINNYSFVKNIIELAGLEVKGTTTYKTTNMGNDGGFWSGVKSVLAENSATLTIPYTAKYGVALGDSALRISKSDSTVIVQMPATQLLSFELHLDRLETSNKKGWFIFDDDEYYNALQKKLYTEARAQLETNKSYLQQSGRRIESILTQYYQPLNMKVVCQFK